MRFTGMIQPSDPSETSRTWQRDHEPIGGSALSTLMYHYGIPTNYRIKPNNQHSADFRTEEGTTYIAWSEPKLITLSSQTLDALKGH